jgi:hypothetical protein
MNAGKVSEVVAGKTEARHGQKIYRTNPSLMDGLPTRIIPQRPTKMGDAYLIAPDTGQVLSKGMMSFVAEKEVDTEEFVKIYLAGIRKYGELKKAGAMIFEFVYHTISGKNGKGNDTVAINWTLANEWKPDLTRPTYQRGMNELLNKEFIFRTVTADYYFVNVRYMFNGDRIALVQSYRRKERKNEKALLQNELPLDEPE